MAWVSPTGFDDPDTKWDDETNAYDENTGTYATSPDIGGDSWGSFLELTRAAIDCSKVQFWAYYDVGSTNQIDLDVYYSDDWHHVYEGAFASLEWVEKSLGGTYSVTKARVRFYNDYHSLSDGYFFEFDFWEVEVVAPTVTTQAATNVEETTATGNGNITDIGGENCDERGVEWGYSSGSYPNSATDTDSYGTGAFTKGMTGLNRGDKVYYRAKAHNSAGWGYGGEQTFITKPNAPSSLNAYNPTINTIDVSWTKGTGAYYTYIRHKAGSYPTSYTDGFQTYTGTGVSGQATGLDPGTLYYFRAWSRAYDAGWGPYSDSYSQDTETTRQLHEKEITEGIAVAEVLIKNPIKNISEGVALGEVLIKMITKAPFVEGIAVGEVVQTVKIHVKEITEGLAIGETVTKLVNKVISEGIAIGEVLIKMRVIAAIRSLSAARVLDALRNLVSERTRPPE